MVQTRKLYLSIFILLIGVNDKALKSMNDNSMFNNGKIPITDSNIFATKHVPFILF